MGALTLGARNARKVDLVARPNPDTGPVAAMRTAVAMASIVGVPVAMAVSYKRNKSIPWAFGSGLVWMPYLIYVGVVD